MFKASNGSQNNTDGAKTKFDLMFFSEEDKEPEVKEPEVKEPENPGINDKEVKEPEKKEPEAKEPEKKEPETPEKKDPEKKEDAPEKYTDFSLPEGMTMNTAALEKATVLFKEFNLTQEQAQKLVDIYAEQVKKADEDAVAAYSKQVEEWGQQTKIELGASYDSEMRFAAKFIDRFGSEKLRELLDQTGLGNHPEIAKCFISAGKAISEDSFPDPGGKAQETVLSRIYNKSPELK